MLLLGDVEVFNSNIYMTLCHPIKGRGKILIYSRDFEGLPV